MFQQGLAAFRIKAYCFIVQTATTSADFSSIVIEEVLKEAATYCDEDKKRIQIIKMVGSKDF